MQHFTDQSLPFILLRGTADRAGRTLKAPVCIQPGQPDGCVTLTLGYGRSRAGRVGNGLGYNAYQLRPSFALISSIFLRIDWADSP